MRIKNWFNSGGRRKNFKRALWHLRGKPATYIEVGVFRGDSLAWVLENILTHEDSNAIGIDPWRAECMGKPWTQEECDENYALSQAAVAPFGDKVTLYRQQSRDWFEVCGPACIGSFDAIYLDGMHDFEPLMADFLSAWQLLKIGGTMIIDDLGARHSQIGRLLGHLDFDFGHRWQVLFRNYQWGCRKVAA